MLSHFQEPRHLLICFAVSNILTLVSQVLMSGMGQPMITYLSIASYLIVSAGDTVIAREHIIAIVWREYPKSYSTMDNLPIITLVPM